MPRSVRADPAMAPASARTALRPLAASRLRAPGLRRLMARRLARAALLALAALAVATLATLGAAAWLESRLATGGRAAAGLAVRPVLVAARDLPQGTRLSASLFVPADWPAAAVGPAHLRPGDSRLATLEGAVLRAPVPAGAPLLEGHVAGGAASGQLSVLLAPGMRAIAIPVSASSAVAGLIAPGDRVDLLLTRTLPSGRTVTTTVASAVRVLGLDQRLGSAPGAEGEALVPATVTLEATPRQAEEIALLETLGRVTLALRRPDEPAADRTQSGRTPAWDSDALGLPASALAPVAAATAAAIAPPPPIAPAPASPLAAAPAPSGPAGGAAPRGVRVERGVEVVRGASFRGDAASPPQAAEP